jgi:hypothetical protein
MLENVFRGIVAAIGLKHKAGVNEGGFSQNSICGNNED